MEAVLGRADSFPWARVRGPVAGLSRAQLRIFSWGRDGVREEELGPRDQEELRHWAFRDLSPGHKCPHCGLALGPKRGPLIGVLKAKMSHSLRDGRALGLSPSYKHTLEEKERGRSLGTPPLLQPLTHTS